MDDTDRLGLPLLSAAQAQKEMTHNEALVLLDAAVQSVVVAVAPPDVPAAPAPGQCWIVGTSATGAWAGRAGAIATWTPGGWRFVAAFEGMTVWSIADAATMRRGASEWVRGIGVRRGAIGDPAGGGIVDAEARDAIVAILAALRGHGLIS